MHERIKATIVNIQAAIEKGRAARTQNECGVASQCTALSAQLAKIHALESALNKVERNQV